MNVSNFQAATSFRIFSGFDLGGTEHAACGFARAHADSGTDRRAYASVRHGNRRPNGRCEIREGHSSGGFQRRHSYFFASVRIKDTAAIPRMTTPSPWPLLKYVTVPTIGRLTIGRNAPRNRNNEPVIPKTNFHAPLKADQNGKCLTETNGNALEAKHRKESWPCGPPPRMKGLRLTAGWLLSKISFTKRNGRSFNGGTHPGRKVAGPT